MKGKPDKSEEKETLHFGQIVWLKTDPEQLDRIITGKVKRPNGFTYLLTCMDFEHEHDKIEISIEKDKLKGINS